MTGSVHLPASLTRRRIDIDPHRVESRVAAYVYGDVLVLAAVAGASTHSIESGTAVALVIATVASTYVAHVLAHSIGIMFGDGDHERVPHTLRDGVPIVSSGVLPAAMLLLGASGSLSTLAAQSVAAAVPLLRIAGTGLIYRRLQDDVPVGRALWVGVGAAAVALLAVVIKLAVSH